MTLPTPSEILAQAPKFEKAVELFEGLLIEAFHKDINLFWLSHGEGFHFRPDVRPASDELYIWRLVAPILEKKLIELGYDVKVSEVGMRPKEKTPDFHIRIVK